MSLEKLGSTLTTEKQWQRVPGRDQRKEKKLEQVQRLLEQTREEVMEESDPEDCAYYHGHVQTLASRTHDAETRWLESRRAEQISVQVITDAPK